MLHDQNHVKLTEKDALLTRPSLKAPSGEPIASSFAGRPEVRGFRGVSMSHGMSHVDDLQSGVPWFRPVDHV